MSSVRTPIALVVFSTQLVACGFGPVERHAGVDYYAKSPNGKVTVALRSFDVYLPPKGLSRLPDGGMSKGLDQGVEVNVCEKTSGTFQRIAVLHEKEKPRPSFSSPRIVAWLDTAIRITRVTGGDTVVHLPDGLRVGNEGDDSSGRTAIPECKAALRALRSSDRMPDGKPMTP